MMNIRPQLRSRGLRRIITTAAHIQPCTAERLCRMQYQRLQVCEMESFDLPIFLSSRPFTSVAEYARFVTAHITARLVFPQSKHAHRSISSLQALPRLTSEAMHLLGQASRRRCRSKIPSCLNCRNAWRLVAFERTEPKSFVRRAVFLNPERSALSMVACEVWRLVAQLKLNSHKARSSARC